MTPRAYLLLAATVSALALAIAPQAEASCTLVGSTKVFVCPPGIPDGSVAQFFDIGSTTFKLPNGMFKDFLGDAFTMLLGGGGASGGGGHGNAQDQANTTLKPPPPTTEPPTIQPPPEPGAAQMLAEIFFAPGSALVGAHIYEAEEEEHEKNEEDDARINEWNRIDSEEKDKQERQQALVDMIGNVTFGDETQYNWGVDSGGAATTGGATDPFVGVDTSDIETALDAQFNQTMEGGGATPAAPPPTADAGATPPPPPPPPPAPTTAVATAPDTDEAGQAAQARVRKTLLAAIAKAKDPKLTPEQRAQAAAVAQSIQTYSQVQVSDGHAAGTPPSP